jgi:uncharacterized membrane protein YdjX (TVP38/TMEM64 family)
MPISNESTGLRASTERPSKYPIRKYVLLGAVPVVALCVYLLAAPILGLSQNIVTYVDQLQATNADVIDRYYLLFLAGYFLAFAATIALCLPFAALMTVIGGLLFGLAGLAAAALSVTLGSVPPFLGARHFAGPALAKIDAGLVARVRRGFERNQFQYLILMRIVPWAPFTVTTIIAGALGMGLSEFLLGTALGFLPMGLAFNAVGHGLGRLSELRSISLLELVTDRDFLLAAAGVAAIALLSFLRKVPGLARLFG